MDGDIPSVSITLPTGPHHPKEIAYAANEGGEQFGEYKLLKVIAKGGMGIVWKARHLKLNRVVALKMILSGGLADREEIDRLKKEATAAAALLHPHIVAVHEIGEVNGQHFFTMDYIEGPSLAGMVQESPLPAKEAAKYVEKIAETMQAAHDSKIIHRDLKPSNILVDKELRPLITDFGLAKRLEEISQLTATGAVLGTPSYMSPEQAAGESDKIGPASDIYSIGAILYELLTGRPPFRAATPAQTMRQVQDQPPLSPRSLNPDVPKDLETICLKCLEKTREQRYPTAQALADDLKLYAEGKPITARPVTKFERAWRWCRRNRAQAGLIVAAALVVVLILGGGIGGYFLAASERKQRTIAEEQTGIAEKRLEETRELLEYLSNVSAEKLSNSHNLSAVRTEMLEKVLAYHQGFVAENASSLDNRKDVAESHSEIAYLSMSLGDPHAADAAYRKSIAVYRQLAEEEPSDEEHRKQLATRLFNLADVRIALRDFEGARRRLDESIVEWNVLNEMAQGSAEYQRGFIGACAKRALTFKIEQDANAVRNYAEAARAYRAVSAQYEAILLQFPDDQVARSGFVTHLLNEAGLATTREEYKLAQTLYLLATAEASTVSNSDPENKDARYMLANAYSGSGNLHRRLQEPQQAREAFTEAIEIQQALYDSNHDDVAFASGLGASLHNFGLFLQNQADAAAAAKAYERSIEVKVELNRMQPSNITFRSNLALSRYNLACLLAETMGGTPQERAARDVRALHECGEVARLLYNDVKEGRIVDEMNPIRFVHACLMLAQLHEKQGNQEAGEEHLRKALEFKAPAELTGMLHITLAASLLKRSEVAKARTSLQIAHDCAANQKSPNCHYNAACAAALLGKLAESDDAKAMHLAAAVAALERAVQFGYADIDHLDADPDLAILRDLPAFQAFRRKLPDRAKDE